MSLFLNSLAILFKYNTASFCAGTTSLKLILKSSFHPIMVLSVPRYETYIVLLFEKRIVTAANCFSSSGTNLLIYLVTKKLENLVLLARALNKLGSSGCNILPRTFPFTYLSYNSCIVTFSSFFINPSNGKYENLANIRLSISLNGKRSILTSLHSK